jgi:hypothetical protein
VPLDEVLGFRREHRKEYAGYALDLRKFVRELSSLNYKEQQAGLRDRQEELKLRAADLRENAKKAWKRKAAFGLGLAGAAWQIHSGDILGGLLTLGAGALGAKLPGSVDAGVHSYLFQAKASLV